MRALLRAYVTLPPSANDRHGLAISQRTGKARKYVRPEVMAWQRETFTLVQAYGWHDVVAIQQCRDEQACWYGLVLRAWLSPKHLLGRDTDNFVKIVSDTIFNQYLAIDDKHISDITLSKRPAPDGSAALVWLGVWEKRLEEVLDVDIPIWPPPSLSKAA